MQIIRQCNFRTTQWKNGGGITHEITAHQGSGYMIWRLSVAEVVSDGPFSIFEGKERILTVIEGSGIELLHDGGKISARPFQPVRFSGELPIDGILTLGGVRNFNLIFDPSQVKAAVELVSPPDIEPLTSTSRREFALFCAEGYAETTGGETLPEDSCTLFRRGLSLTKISPQTKLLLVTLDLANQSSASRSSIELR